MLAECFYLSSHYATWQEARSHCLALGGDLATPTDIARLFSFTLDNGAEGMNVQFSLYYNKLNNTSTLFESTNT